MHIYKKDTVHAGKSYWTFSHPLCFLIDSCRDCLNVSYSWNKNAITGSLLFASNNQSSHRLHPCLSRLITSDFSEYCMVKSKVSSLRACFDRDRRLICLWSGSKPITGSSMRHKHSVKKPKKKQISDTCPHVHPIELILIDDKEAASSKTWILQIQQPDLYNLHSFVTGQYLTGRQIIPIMAKKKIWCHRDVDLWFFGHKMSSLHDFTFWDIIVKLCHN